MVLPFYDPNGNESLPPTIEANIIDLKVLPSMTGERIDRDVSSITESQKFIQANIEVTDDNHSSIPESCLITYTRCPEEAVKKALSPRCAPNGNASLLPSSDAKVIE